MNAGDQPRATICSGSPLSAPADRTSPVGRGNHDQRLGKHGSVHSKLSDAVRDYLADQPRLVEIVRSWGTVLIDADDLACLDDWYLTFPGVVGKQRVLLIPKLRPKGARSIALGRLLLNPARDMVVDHINGDVLDNRRCNLRVCTMQENNWNRKRRKGGASRFKGVARDHNNRSRWMSLISRPTGGNIYLGSFVNEEDAARAYDVAARARYGKFGAFNFPNAGERCAALPVQPFNHEGEIANVL